jgi:hypothetical protein
VGGLPSTVGVEHVEVEAGGGERAVERRELVERAVEPVVVEVVGDGHVRVVGVAELHVEGSLTTGLRELLGLRDALDEVDEDDRRDRPEGAGAPQMDPVGMRAPRHVAEVLLDLVQVGDGDLDGWDEGDVCRDRPSLGVAVRHPELLEATPPRLRDGDGDTDGRHGQQPTRRTAPSLRTRHAGRRRARSRRRWRWPCGVPAR